MDSSQLTLPFVRHDEAGLARLIGTALCRPVTLRLTDNASSLMSARTVEGILVLRLHRVFLEADDGVIEELSRYLISGRGKTPRFWAFVKSNRHRIPRKKSVPRRVRIVTEGAHHDLGEIFSAVNAEYFDSGLSCSITWGRGAQRARTRILGSYASSSDMIRINPCLDRRHVPRYYVEFVVYHEMLHAVLTRGAEPGPGGRRRLHPPEFRQSERLFRHYDRAMKWERG